MFASVLLVLAGLAALYQGGNALLAGASGLAKHFGLPPLLVGLTIVAFATSAPELAVSLLAAANGNPDIAVGNVLGSNVFNTLVAVGVVVLLTPVRLSRGMLNREIPFGVLACLVVAGFAWTGHTIGRFEGGVLVAGLIAFLVFTIRAARREGQTGDETPEPDEQEAELNPGAAAMATASAGGAAVLDMATLALSDLAVPGLSVLTLINARLHTRTPTIPIRILAILFGLGLLIAGSSALVEGAQALAFAAGIPEAVVGLTVVAIGTSAPELATAVLAARKSQADLAIGNALGSNLFNLLAVLGLAALVLPIPVSGEFLGRDLWVALGAAAVLLLARFNRGRLPRWAGGVLIVGWLIYTTALVAGSLSG